MGFGLACKTWQNGQISSFDGMHPLNSASIFNFSGVGSQKVAAEIEFSNYLVKRVIFLLYYTVTKTDILS